MPNRTLNREELEKANELLADIRRLNVLAEDDLQLLFAYRRKVAKMLTYDERSSPMARRRLKIFKRKQQSGMCPVCAKELPRTYCVLDRFDAAAGYIDENTRLLCEQCDRQVQQRRRYT